MIGAGEGCRIYVGNSLNVAAVSRSGQSCAAKREPEVAACSCHQPLGLDCTKAAARERPEVAESSDMEPPRDSPLSETLLTLSTTTPDPMSSTAWG